MLKNKKAISILCSILLSSTMLTGCGNGVIGMVSNEYNKQEQQNEYNDEYKQKEDYNPSYDKNNPTYYSSNVNTIYDLLKDSLNIEINKAITSAGDIAQYFNMSFVKGTDEVVVLLEYDKDYFDLVIETNGESLYEDIVKPNLNMTQVVYDSVYSQTGITDVNIVFRLQTRNSYSPFVYMEFINGNVTVLNLGNESVEQFIMDKVYGTEYVQGDKEKKSADDYKYVSCKYCDTQINANDSNGMCTNCESSPESDPNRHKPQCKQCNTYIEQDDYDVQYGMCDNCFEAFQKEQDAHYAECKGGCGTVLSKSVYNSQDGYCSNCYKPYGSCSDCGKALESSDKSGRCSSCAENHKQYACDCCGQTISYTYGSLFNFSYLCESCHSSLSQGWDPRPCRQCGEICNLNGDIENQLCHDCVLEMYE